MYNKEYYSYSKVNCYENCPRKFEFIYKKFYPKSSNVFALKGTLLHAMIELYINGDDFDIPHEGDFEKLPLEEFNKFKEEFENIKKQPLIQQLKKIYGNYEVVEMESKLSNIFDDFSFNGKADTLVKNGNKVIIIDYKTGAIREDFTQLKYYALIASILYPEVEDFLLVLSYVAHNTDKRMVIKKSDIEEINEELLTKITDIIKVKTFEKKLSRLCDYCEYKNECMMKDQFDKVENDILDSKNILPSSFSGPIVWDGYIGSKVVIINDFPLENDFNHKTIFARNTEEGEFINNMLNEYEMKKNHFLLLNKTFFVNKDFKPGENKYANINEDQFKTLLSMTNSEHYVIFGKENFEKITKLEGVFQHDTKIEWKGKTLFMFEHPTRIINEIETELTYNLLEEIKEILS